jgi:GntR family transcriptional regulator/MocR family aminotransferase
VEYDFTNEFLDKESFDFQLWKKYINKALRYNDVYLSYGSCLGEYILRREIARYIGHSRGVICSPDQVIVGAGVQAVLNILCAVLKPKYDSIVFEEPGFTKGQYVFKDHGFKIVPVSVEDDGINVRHLAGNGGKVVYVSPSHQYPTGSVMSINKRTQLLNWANASNGIIIEDDYDSELRYFGRPIPSLQGLNKGNGIVYLGSFSKIMLPSIRISFMVLPVNLLEETADILNRYNQTSSKIEQVALALFMKEGLLEKHIRKLRKIYAPNNFLFRNTNVHTDSISHILTLQSILLLLKILPLL